MPRTLVRLLVVLLMPHAAWGQDPAPPPVDRKPYTFGGFAEARPSTVWFDADAAQFRIQPQLDDARRHRRLQLDSRLQLDASYRRNWLGAQVRAVAEAGYAGGDWAGKTGAYEAFVSLKPSPSLTIDAGKKTLKWGKGYLWNPTAFLDRPKSPEDPSLALEGFTVVSADYIRTFDGPLQVMSATPVLLPVFSNVNSVVGDTGHVNFAGKVYTLLYDADIDVMFLSGASRPWRVGVDVSRNLRSNLEVHGEWALVPGLVTRTLTPSDTLQDVEHRAISAVVGIRFLTAQNTTYIVDYYRNGGGYTTDEMRRYFALVSRATDTFAVTGDDDLLMAARRASGAGYGQLNPMRNYIYARVTQPDALGVLYLLLGVSTMVNVDDGSFALFPEVQYRASGRLELRGLANLQRGGRRTEFGERPADARVELRIRYYF